MEKKKSYNTGLLTFLGCMALGSIAIVGAAFVGIYDAIRA